MGDQVSHPYGSIIIFTIWTEDAKTNQSEAGIQQTQYTLTSPKE
jgi:hypothetical protein